MRGSECGLEHEGTDLVSCVPVRMEYLRHFRHLLSAVMDDVGFRFRQPAGPAPPFLHSRHALAMCDLPLATSSAGRC